MSEQHRIRLSNYEKIKSLGSGSIGKTYQVRHRQTQALAVTKFVKGAPPPDLLDALAGISHRALLPLTGYALPEKLRPLALVCPFVPGGSLGDLISTGPEPTPLVKMKLLFGIAEGMRHLESLGRSHGGLGLGNVLLGENFEPLISDFGLSHFRPAPTPDIVSFGRMCCSIVSGRVDQVADSRLPVAFQCLVRDCIDGRATFESVVVDFLSAKTLLPLDPDDLDQFQDYEAHVLHPMFSADVLLNVIDELNEMADLHSQLAATVALISRKLESVEESRLAPVERPPEDGIASPRGRHSARLQSDIGLGRRGSVMPVRPLRGRLTLQSARQSSVTALEITPPKHNPPRSADSPDADEDEPEAPQVSTAVSLPHFALAGKSSFPYVHQPFDGIFAHFSREYEGNILNLGIIGITGNSLSGNHSRDLRRLIEHDWKGCWVSSNVPESWLMIDFGARTVFVSHYSLRTYHCAKGYSHLKSWILEGSIRGRTFRLDARSDNEELNGRWKTATFQCFFPAECQAVKLKQTGPNHHGDDFLILRSIELFGDLV
jgi:serine/threonine protein kinase